MQLASLFNFKAKLWVSGRKNTFSDIEKVVKPIDKVIWMHVSSLGEYEQGLPVFTALKEKYPNYKFAISFFSPSGYEVIKNKIQGDLIFYLPLDTRENAIRLTKLLHPEYVIFVKYDFWYQLLDTLHNQGVKVIFISAIFREKQIYFKPQGKWFVSILKNVSYFFVQNKKSKELLNSIGINSVKVSGDTRFDRVKMLLDRNNTLEWLEEFKKDSLLVVAGSTWKRDNELLINFIKQNSQQKVKFLIAPHNMDDEYFKTLKKKLGEGSILYSELGEGMKNYQILILDTVGLLTKVYSYADIVYVGGAFGKEGVHNVLEPAVFGIPVFYGPIFDKFIEAKELLDVGGSEIVDSESNFNSVLLQLISDDKKRKEMGSKAQNYILNKPNSTQLILDYIMKSI